MSEQPQAGKHGSHGGKDSRGWASPEHIRKTFEKEHGEQPPSSAKATEGKQEWTEGKVFAYFEREDFKGLAEAINAALAAEHREFTELEELYREVCQDYYSAKIETEKVQTQLDAERKKVNNCEVVHRHRETIELLKDREKLLVDALELCLDALGDCDDTAKRLAAVLNGNTALAKVKELDLEVRAGVYE